MRRICFPLVMMALAVATSCGSQKEMAAMQQQMMMMQMQQQGGYSQQQQQNVKSQRIKNAAELKAEENSSSLRAVGIARSYDESTLRVDAINNAQIQLAQMIEASIEGAIVNYNNNSSSNTKMTTSGSTERVMTSYIAQELRNTPVIESVMYDYTDGSTQMYVCIELRVTTEQVLDNVANNILSQDEVQRIQFDRDRFKSEISQGLEEYKQRQREQ